MKKIITAINNPKLNEELKKQNNFEIVCKDIQYKEAILEILEENKKIDIIIISEQILGEINFENLIKKIKLINEKIKIIFILENKNNNLEKILIKNNINEIYYNNEINLFELIKIINKKEINMEEEIIKLKKIIEEKNINYNKLKNNYLEKNEKIEFTNNEFKHEMKEEKAKENERKSKKENQKLIKNFYKVKNKKRTKDVGNQKEKKDNNRNKKKWFNNAKKGRIMLNKIITFSGNYKSGKTTLALAICHYLSLKKYRVLLVDCDFEKQDLRTILRNKYGVNINENKYIKRKNFVHINDKKRCKNSKRKLEINGIKYNENEKQQNNIFNFKNENKKCNKNRIIKKNYPKTIKKINFWWLKSKNKIKIYSFKIIKIQKFKCNYKNHPKKIKNLLNSYTKKISKNFYFFPVLKNIFEKNEIKNEYEIENKINILFNIIMGNFDFVIFDFGKNNFSHINEEILKRSDKNFMVMESNLLGIKEIK